MDVSGTLTEMATVLAAAFIGGAVVHKLRQPVLVGYILVGLLLGPSGLALIHDEQQIKFMAELGILLLLFIVGIELDLRKFRPVYRIAVITTAFQIVFALIIMAAVGALADWPAGRILLMAFAVSLSSTAVALKLVQDMNAGDTNLGRTAVGILIAQDIAVIPMMLIVGMMGGEGIGALKILKIIAAMGLMAGVIWFLTHQPAKITRWIDALPHNSQTTIMALAFCFAAAALSGVLGVSAAYGAFLAGLIIGNTAQSHIYEENIRPVFDILIMVFFLSIGLLIDIVFITENLWAVLGLLILIMLLKTAVNISLLRWQGMPRRGAFIAGAALSQIGEFSFVLAALGLASGTIQDTGYKYVVSLIALSLVFTPLWLYGLRRVFLLRRYMVRRGWMGQYKSS